MIIKLNILMMIDYRTFDYINNGFYYDLDERFDIMSLIEQNNDDYDY